MKLLLLLALFLWMYSFYNAMTTVRSCHQKCVQDLAFSIHMMILLVIVHLSVISFAKNLFFKAVIKGMRRRFTRAECSLKKLEVMKFHLEEPFEDRDLGNWFLWKCTINAFAIISSLAVYFVIKYQYHSIIDLKNNTLTYYNDENTKIRCLPWMKALGLAELLLRALYLLYVVIVCLMAIKCFVRIMVRRNKGKNIVFKCFGPPCYKNDIEWVQSLPMISWDFLQIVSSSYPDMVFKNYIHALVKKETLRKDVRQEKLLQV